MQDVWKAILTESGRMDRHIDVLEVSVGARDFLRALLQRDPSKRVSATQALQLPVRFLIYCRAAVDRGRIGARLCCRTC